MRRGAATILLFASALSLAAAVVIVLSGGFTVDFLRLSLRDPVRPLVAGLVLLAAAWVAAGDAFVEIARPYTGSRAGLPARIAALVSACVLVFALAWSSRAAGGSDSSCYVLQAEAFAGGRVALDNPVARVLPDAPNAMFAPTGFLPSPREHGQAVPICAPGLAMAMAVASFVHPSAVFLVVPACAALLVWLTFLYGRRLDGALTGVCAAVLVACSPIFLYQAVQPMSDVPAAAAWLMALVLVSRGDRVGAIGGGMYAASAILVRPNLALLVLPLFLLTPKKGDSPLFRDREKGAAPFSRFWKWGLSPFSVAIVPGVAGLLVLNALRYGSPLTSGYGDTDALFTRAHVSANLLRYPRWLIETQTPVLLLALAAPWALRRDRERARLAWISLACVALLAATYLAYTVFDDWWYLRFLLPALPIAIAMSVAVLRSATAWLPPAARPIALAAIAALLAAQYLHVAEDRRVTDLQRLESRFVLAGDYARRNLPENAVVLAVQLSGSIRFHGRRDTVTWDAIPGDTLDAYVERLRAAGRTPYIALEDAEEERFRARFAGQRLGALDWRPIAELRAPARVRFYETIVADKR